MEYIKFSLVSKLKQRVVVKSGLVCFSALTKCQADKKVSKWDPKSIKKQ